MAFLNAMKKKRTEAARVKEAMKGDNTMKIVRQKIEAERINPKDLPF
jgi:hypothetical protein